MCLVIRRWLDGKEAPLLFQPLRPSAPCQPPRTASKGAAGSRPARAAAVEACLPRAG